MPSKRKSSCGVDEDSLASDFMSKKPNIAIDNRETDDSVASNYTCGTTEGYQLPGNNSPHCFDTHGMQRLNVEISTDTVIASSLPASTSSTQEFDDFSVPVTNSFDYSSELPPFYESFPKNSDLDSTKCFNGSLNYASVLVNNPVDSASFSKSSTKPSTEYKDEGNIDEKVPTVSLNDESISRNISQTSIPTSDVVPSSQPLSHHHTSGTEDVYVSSLLSPLYDASSPPLLCKPRLFSPASTLQRILVPSSLDSTDHELATVSTQTPTFQSQSSGSGDITAGDGESAGAGASGGGGSVGSDSNVDSSVPSAVTTTNTTPTAATTATSRALASPTFASTSSSSPSPSLASSSSSPHSSHPSSSSSSTPPSSSPSPPPSSTPWWLDGAPTRERTRTRTSSQHRKITEDKENFTCTTMEAQKHTDVSKRSNDREVNVAGMGGVDVEHREDSWGLQDAGDRIGRTDHDSGDANSGCVLTTYTSTTCHDSSVPATTATATTTAAVSANAGADGDSDVNGGTNANVECVNAFDSVRSPPPSPSPVTPSSPHSSRTSPPSLLSPSSSPSTTASSYSAPRFWLLPAPSFAPDSSITSTPTPSSSSSSSTHTPSKYPPISHSPASRFLSPSRPPTLPHTRARSRVPSSSPSSSSPSTSTSSASASTSISANTASTIATTNDIDTFTHAHTHANTDPSDTIVTTARNISSYDPTTTDTLARGNVTTQSDNIVPDAFEEPSFAPSNFSPSFSPSYFSPTASSALETTSSSSPSHLFSISEPPFSAFSSSHTSTSTFASAHGHGRDICGESDRDDVGGEEREEEDEDDDDVEEDAEQEGERERRDDRDDSGEDDYSHDADNSDQNAYDEEKEKKTPPPPSSPQTSSSSRSLPPWSRESTFQLHSQPRAFADTADAHNDESSGSTSGGSGSGDSAVSLFSPSSSSRFSSSSSSSSFPHHISQPHHTDPWRSQPPSSSPPALSPSSPLQPHAHSSHAHSSSSSSCSASSPSSSSSPSLPSIMPLSHHQTNTPTAQLHHQPQTLQHHPHVTHAKHLSHIPRMHTHVLSLTSQAGQPQPQSLTVRPHQHQLQPHTHPLTLPSPSPSQLSAPSSSAQHTLTRTHPSFLQALRYQYSTAISFERHARGLTQASRLALHQYTHVFTQIADLGAELSDYRRELDSVYGKIRQMTSQHASDVNQLGHHLRKALTEKEKEKKHFVSVLNTMWNKQQRLVWQVKRERKAKMTAEDRLQKLRRHTRTHARLFTHTISSLKSGVTTLHGELSTIRSKYHSDTQILAHEVKKMWTKYQETEKEVDLWKNRCDEVLALCAEADASLSQAHQDKTALQSALAHAEHECKAWQGKHTEIVAILATLEERMTKMAQEEEQRRMEWQEEREAEEKRSKERENEMNAERKTWSDQKEGYVRKIDVYTSECEVLKAKLAQFERETADQENIWENRFQTLSREQSELVAERDSLRDKVGELSRKAEVAGEENMRVVLLLREVEGRCVEVERKYVEAERKCVDVEEMYERERMERHREKQDRERERQRDMEEREKERREWEERAREAKEREKAEYMRKEREKEEREEEERRRQELAEERERKREEKRRKEQARKERVRKRREENRGARDGAVDAGMVVHAVMPPIPFSPNVIPTLPINSVPINAANAVPTVITATTAATAGIYAAMNTDAIAAVSIAPPTAMYGRGYVDTYREVHGNVADGDDDNEGISGVLAGSVAGVGDNAVFTNIEDGFTYTISPKRGRRTHAADNGNEGHGHGAGSGRGSSGGATAVARASEGRERREQEDDNNDSDDNDDCQANVDISLATDVGDINVDLGISAYSERIAMKGEWDGGTNTTFATKTEAVATARSHTRPHTHVNANINNNATGDTNTSTAATTTATNDANDVAVRVNAGVGDRSSLSTTPPSTSSSASPSSSSRPLRSSPSHRSAHPRQPRNSPLTAPALPQSPPSTHPPSSSLLPPPPPLENTASPLTSSHSPSPMHTHHPHRIERTPTITASTPTSSHTSSSSAPLSASATASPSTSAAVSDAYTGTSTHTQESECDGELDTATLTHPPQHHHPQQQRKWPLDTSNANDDANNADDCDDHDDNQANSDYAVGDHHDGASVWHTHATQPQVRAQAPAPTMWDEMRTKREKEWHQHIPTSTHTRIRTPTHGNSRPYTNTSTINITNTNPNATIGKNTTTAAYADIAGSVDVGMSAANEVNVDGGDDGDVVDMGLFEYTDVGMDQAVMRGVQAALGVDSYEAELVEECSDGNEYEGRHRGGDRSGSDNDDDIYGEGRNGRGDVYVDIDDVRDGKRRYVGMGNMNLRVDNIYNRHVADVDDDDNDNDNDHADNMYNSRVDDGDDNAINNTHTRLTNNMGRVHDNLTSTHTHSLSSPLSPSLASRRTSSPRFSSPVSSSSSRGFTPLSPTDNASPRPVSMHRKPHMQRLNTHTQRAAHTTHHTPSTHNTPTPHANRIPSEPTPITNISTRTTNTNTSPTPTPTSSFASTLTASSTSNSGSSAGSSLPTAQAALLEHHSSSPMYTPPPPRAPPKKRMKTGTATRKRARNTVVDADDNGDVAYIHAKRHDVGVIEGMSPNSSISTSKGTGRATGISTARKIDFDGFTNDSEVNNGYGYGYVYPAADNNIIPDDNFYNDNWSAVAPFDASTTTYASGNVGAAFPIGVDVGGAVGYFDGNHLDFDMFSDGGGTHAGFTYARSSSSSGDRSDNNNGVGGSGKSSGNGGGSVGVKKMKKKRARDNAHTPTRTPTTSAAIPSLPSSSSTSPPLSTVFPSSSSSLLRSHSRGIPTNRVGATAHHHYRSPPLSSTFSPSLPSSFSPSLPSSARAPALAHPHPRAHAASHAVRSTSLRPRQPATVDVHRYPGLKREYQHGYYGGELSGSVSADMGKGVGAGMGTGAGVSTGVDQGPRQSYYPSYATPRDDSRGYTHPHPHQHSHTHAYASPYAHTQNSDNHQHFSFEDGNDAGVYGGMVSGGRGSALGGVVAREDEEYGAGVVRNLRVDFEEFA